jgi:MoaA/NifB/PqqE/SkfB family radical SAM enzyme
MCGIWAEKPKTTFDMAQYESMMKQKGLRGVHLIALTGGEPFALKNFYDYYLLARKFHPRSHINISTNGFYTTETIQFLEKVNQRKTSITISYDGIHSHDSIRGINGSSKNLLETATQIKYRFPKILLSLKMTVTTGNHSEIFDTALQCKKLGIPFRFKMLEKLNCHQSRFPSEIDGPDYSPEIEELIINQAVRVLELGIETNEEYIRKLIKKNKGIPVSCGCSPHVVFIGIDGKVFLCRKKEPIGNLFSETFENIWNSKHKFEMVKKMDKCNSSPMGMAFTND